MPVVDILNPQTPIPEVQSNFTIIDNVEANIDLNDDAWSTDYFVIFFHNGSHDPVATSTLKTMNKMEPPLPCKVIAVSIDTTPALFKWLDSDPELKDFKIPLMSDKNYDISKKFGVLHKHCVFSGHTRTGFPVNSVFIVDGEDRVRYHAVLDSNAAFNISEISRLVSAFESTDGGQHLAMSDWKTSDDTVPNLIPSIQHYYGSNYGDRDHSCPGCPEDVSIASNSSHSSPAVSDTSSVGDFSSGLSEGGLQAAGDRNSTRNSNSKLSSKGDFPKHSLPKKAIDTSNTEKSQSEVKKNGESWYGSFIKWMRGM